MVYGIIICFKLLSTFISPLSNSGRQINWSQTLLTAKPLREPVEKYEDARY